MAEERKPAKTTTGASSNRQTAEHITYLLVGLVLLGAVITALLNYIDSLGLGAAGSLWDRIGDYFLERIWPIWKLVAVIVSLLALAGIIYNSLKLRAINIEERKIYNPTPASTVSDGEGDRGGK